MEHTLTIIKPDATARNLCGEIIRRFEQGGFAIRAMRMTRLTSDEARKFYTVHEKRPFFDSLCTFMSSGPIVPMILEKENAIEDLRELIGATDPVRAACGTLRSDLAEGLERNSVHASDGPASAKTEIAFFFSE